MAYRCMAYRYMAYRCMAYRCSLKEKGATDHTSHGIKGRGKCKRRNGKGRKKGDEGRE
jgi:hypothetical protein